MDFLEISQFPKILNIKLLGNSWGSDNNQVFFHLWWTEIVLKYEEAYIYFFHDCLKIVFFSFNFFENARKLQKTISF